VEAVRLSDNTTVTVRSPNTILATGGFASDRSPGSYLDRHRPELMNMAATAGKFSTGDGIEMATALGAGTVDMDYVQIHPTGWVDPADPANTEKVLAAELMRGVGGVLLNGDGKRFCNELGTRAYVTDRMLRQDPQYNDTRVWDVHGVVPTFSLVLAGSAAEEGKKHVDLYTHKGLLTTLHGVGELARWMGVEEDPLRTTLLRYRLDALLEQDMWGKATPRGIPEYDLDAETFHAGTVTPVLHYCMGGIEIDGEGNVLEPGGGSPIAGLHAAGEVAGGVHGHNRLGGNSLLECTVFGRIVGSKVPVADRRVGGGRAATAAEEFTAVETDLTRAITLEELAAHDTPEDCWVAIHGKVYDLTDFAPEHPPGVKSITRLGGTDGTAAFHAVHNRGMLDDFDDVQIGTYMS